MNLLIAASLLALHKSIYNPSRLLKISGLKYIFVLVEFKQTEFFTSYGGNF